MTTPLAQSAVRRSEERLKSMRPKQIGKRYDRKRRIWINIYESRLSTPEKPHPWGLDGIKKRISK